ncbi:ATPase, T2SS/T4P/T4SS family [Castellaniella caeni]|uniref:ATPase, T2SS/T4P/T4SS family n=1 Tax=Castellaniella caeni TaxID=266123 RepID=UPI00082B9CD6|nr:ATPase, T2SS/T4P/T4SS family [Castellaniella caeni]
MAQVELELRFEDGRIERGCYPLPVSIGRDPACSLNLKTWRVARHHAQIVLREDQLWLEDGGSIFGSIVNGARVASFGPIEPQDELVIGPCLLQVRQRLEDAPAVPPAASPPPAVSAQSPSLVVPSLADAACELHEPEPVTAHRYAHSPAGQQIRRRLHEGLIAALQLRRRDIAGMSDAALRAEATRVLQDLMAADAALPPQIDPARLLRELVDEAVGLGPLEPLLADPAVTEIMVNRHDEIFVERGGCLVRDTASFSGEAAVLGVIERIVSPLGRRIDESAPMVDARLRDGSRVNAVIAPIALRGASLTIRKFPARRLTMDDLLATGALDVPMARFLSHCVRQRKNLVVSGGTGSGKTSLLNILSNAIPAHERIITIEDAAELRLNHDHLVSLEARPPNLEGRGRIDIRDLVRNALRMRPDRIVVGECRGGEAFDMLAAMNTGHEGSLTTLHANSPRDALGRLETMILMAGMDLPLAAVREHIAAAIDFIVQLSRAADGRRLLTAIVQVTGIESGRIQLQDLFLGEAGPPAVFQGCGLLPEGFSGLAALDIGLFSQRTVRQGHAVLADGARLQELPC